MTNLNRLILELNNQKYLSNEDYVYLLDENCLPAEEEFAPVSNQLAMKRTVLSVFQILANDIDLYRKVKTEFLTTGEAIQAVNKRICQLKADIVQLENESSNANSCVSYLFRGRC